MSSSLTPEQVLALAPDAASAKAGSALAAPRKWSALGADGAGVVWGECQGSGAEPYRVRADLSEPAYRCSCPSRKFPCKHVLGMLLLRAGSPVVFAAGEPPAWVAEWIAERRQRSERRAARAQTSDDGAAPAATGAQRATARSTRVADARAAKVDAGLRELGLWLRDLVRGGLATAPGRPLSFWDGMAARLVDAQAPGAARLVRQLGAIPSSGEGWTDRLLARLARLYLLVEAYGRLDALGDALRADVRATVGWTLTEAELASEPATSDRWLVVGQALEEEDRLRARRTWLRGGASKRTALLLHFAHGTTPFAEALPPVGAPLDAELVFHPGGWPQRASIRATGRVPAGAAMPDDAVNVLPPAATRLREALQGWASGLAANPWLERVPLIVRAALERAGDGWRLRDEAGDVLPVARAFRAGWELLALSGGDALWLSGEWDGEALLPLAAAPRGGAPAALTAGAVA